MNRAATNPKAFKVAGNLRAPIQMNLSRAGFQPVGDGKKQAGCLFYFPWALGDRSLPSLPLSRSRKAWTARTIYKTIALLFALHHSLLAIYSASSTPNIVYIISDDQYFQDFGFMGNEQVITPHLDRLAEQSAFYPNGYVPSSVCRPSLASLLTGLYPHQHKIYFNHPPPGFSKLTRDPKMTKARFDALRQAGADYIKKVDALPKLLVEKGYRCLQTGKYWEGHWQNAGFTQGMTLAEPSGGANGDKQLPNGDMVAHGNGDAGLAIGREGMKPITDFLDDFGDEHPFFIWYAPFLPHTPHDSPQTYFDQYPENSITNYKRPYYAAITQFDDTVGQLVSEIENRGLASKTLFVFVVDNGFEPRLDQPNQYTTNSKRSPFEPGHRTPILLRWDGVIEPGPRDAFVSSLDLFPTSLAAAGIEYKGSLPGINLLPNAKEFAALPKDRAIFGEIYPGDATVLGDASVDIAYRWIRQGDYKLIVPTSSHPWNNYLNTVQLFNLDSDPNESVNLANERPYRMIRQKLRAQLDVWWTP